VKLRGENRPNYHGEAHGLLTAYYTTYTYYFSITFLATVYISPWHITPFIKQHTRHFWTHLIVLCSLEREDGVVVLRWKMFSSNTEPIWLAPFQQKALR
jgi:hypothetical protein